MNQYVFMFDIYILHLKTFILRMCDVFLFLSKASLKASVKIDKLKEFFN